MVQMASIGPMLGQLNHFQLLPAKWEPYGLGRYTEQAERLYRLLDDRLAKREWIAGDAISIADFATYPWAHYLEQHGYDAGRHPNLLRWRQPIDTRPSIQRVSDCLAAKFAEIASATRLAATSEDLDRFFSPTECLPTTDYSSVTR